MNPTQSFTQSGPMDDSHHDAHKALHPTRIMQTSQDARSMQFGDSSEWQPQATTASARKILTQTPAPYSNRQPQSQDHRLKQRGPSTISLLPASHHHERQPENVATQLLPYCTTEPPLPPDQIIALSDIAGNLQELVVLALVAAAGDPACGEKLVNAVGHKAASNIVEFFINEWEVE